MSADVKIILIGLLPRDVNKSKLRKNFLKANNFLKQSCKDEPNLHYLEQDCNWVHKDQSLTTSLHYKSYLEMLTKLNCKHLPLRTKSSLLSSSSSL